MPITIKIAFTIAIGLLALGLLATTGKANSAGPNWLWRLGKSDPVRNLIYRADGSLRRFTKLVALFFFALFLSVIWLVIPTN